MPKPHEIRRELDEYVDVLLGRKEPPIEHGVLSLMEVANAYYSRAQEINMTIHRAEADGVVQRGSTLYKLRTGELRDFIELASKAADLGSRRLTAAQLEIEQRLG